jgi:hypothetical protein
MEERRIHFLCRAVDLEHGLPVLRPWNWTGTMPPDFLNFWLIENRLWDFLAFIIA